MVDTALPDAALPDVSGLSTAQKIALAHRLVDSLATDDLTGLSNDDLVTVAQSTEQLITRITVQGDRQIVEFSDRHLAREYGFGSTTDAMIGLLRVSEPWRRWKQLKATATFHTFTGEVAAPKYPALAEA
ncbi:HNH endonuclease, partial [Gordonia polyisoprenivorans]